MNGVLGADSLADIPQANSSGARVGAKPVWPSTGAHLAYSDEGLNLGTARKEYSNANSREKLSNKLTKQLDDRLVDKHFCGTVNFYGHTCVLLL